MDHELTAGEPGVSAPVEKALVLFVTLLLSVVTAAVFLSAEDTPVQAATPGDGPFETTEGFIEVVPDDPVTVDPFLDPDPAPPTSVESGIEVLVDPPGQTVPSDSRSYEVRTGDTFERIARRELGDARHTAALVAANRGVDPRRLLPGTEIVLPLVPEAPARPERAPAVADRPLVAGGRVTVRSGDTLGDIAQRMTGRASDWKALWTLNQGRVRDPHRIRPGLELALPATWRGSRPR